MTDRFALGEHQKLFDLHSRGGLSKEEFEMAKRMLFSM